MDTVLQENGDTSAEREIKEEGDSEIQEVRLNNGYHLSFLQQQSPASLPVSVVLPPLAVSRWNSHGKSASEVLPVCADFRTPQKLCPVCCCALGGTCRSSTTCTTCCGSGTAASSAVADALHLGRGIEFSSTSPSWDSRRNTAVPSCLPSICCEDSISGGFSQGLLNCSTQISDSQNRIQWDKRMRRSSSRRCYGTPSADSPVDALPLRLRSVGSIPPPHPLEQGDLDMTHRSVCLGMILSPERRPVSFTPRNNTDSNYVESHFSKTTPIFSSSGRGRPIGSEAVHLSAVVKTPEKASSSCGKGPQRLSLPGTFRSQTDAVPLVESSSIAGLDATHNSKPDSTRSNLNGASSNRAVPSRRKSFLSLISLGATSKGSRTSLSKEASDSRGSSQPQLHQSNSISKREKITPLYQTTTELSFPVRSTPTEQTTATKVLPRLSSLFKSHRAASLISRLSLSKLTVPQVAPKQSTPSQTNRPCDISPTSLYSCPRRSTNSSTRERAQRHSSSDFPQLFRNVDSHHPTILVLRRGRRNFDASAKSEGAQRSSPLGFETAKSGGYDHRSSCQISVSRKDRRRRDRIDSPWSDQAPYLQPVYQREDYQCTASDKYKKSSQYTSKVRAPHHNTAGSPIHSFPIMSSYYVKSNPMSDQKLGPSVQSSSRTLHSTELHNNERNERKVGPHLNSRHPNFPKVGRGSSSAQGVAVRPLRLTTASVPQIIGHPTSSREEIVRASKRRTVMYPNRGESQSYEIVSKDYYRHGLTRDNKNRRNSENQYTLQQRRSSSSRISPVRCPNRSIDRRHHSRWDECQYCPPRRKRTLYDDQTRQLLRVGVRESEAEDSAASGVRQIPHRREMPHGSERIRNRPRFPEYSDVKGRLMLPLLDTIGNSSHRHLKRRHHESVDGGGIRNENSSHDKYLTGSYIPTPPEQHSSYRPGSLVVIPTSRLPTLLEVESPSSSLKTRNDSSEVYNLRRRLNDSPLKASMGRNKSSQQKAHLGKRKTAEMARPFTRKTKTTTKQDPPRLSIPSRPGSPLWRSILEGYEDSQVEWREKHDDQSSSLKVDPSVKTIVPMLSTEYQLENLSIKEGRTYVKERRSLQARALLSPRTSYHYSLDKKRVPSLHDIQRGESVVPLRKDNRPLRVDEDPPQYPIMFSDEPFLKFSRNLHRHSMRKSVDGRRTPRKSELSSIFGQVSTSPSISESRTFKSTACIPEISELPSDVSSTKDGVSDTASSFPSLSICLPPRNMGSEFINLGYEHLHILSHGGAGCAHVVRSIDDGELWVAKVVDLARLSPEEVEIATLEADYLQRLHHPFILRFKESFITPTSLIIITEYCKGGDLFSRVQRASKFGDLGWNICGSNSQVLDDVVTGVARTMSDDELRCPTIEHHPYLQDLTLPHLWNSQIVASDVSINSPLSPSFSSIPVSPFSWPNAHKTSGVESCRSSAHSAPIISKSDELIDFCLPTDSQSDETDRISPHQIVQWITQLALGLQYMHSQKILHCDLKSSNIFLTKDGTAKIGDLGIARELKQEGTLTPQRFPRGTPIYMSPELCRGKELTDKADSWALGCVLYELVFRKHAFQDVAGSEITTRRSLMTRRSCTLSSTVGRISLEIDRRIAEVQAEIHNFGEVTGQRRRRRRRMKTKDSDQCREDVPSGISEQVKESEVTNIYREDAVPLNELLECPKLGLPFLVGESGERRLFNSSSDNSFDAFILPNRVNDKIFNASSESDGWIDRSSPESHQSPFATLLQSQLFEPPITTKRRRSLPRLEHRAKKMRLFNNPFIRRARHHMSTDSPESSSNHDPIPLTLSLAHSQSHSQFDSQFDSQSSDLKISDSQDWAVIKSPKSRPIISSSSSSDGSNTSTENPSELFSVRLIHHLLAALLQPDPQDRPSFHEVLDMLYSAEYLPDDETPASQTSVWTSLPQGDSSVQIEEDTIVSPSGVCLDGDISLTQSNDDILHSKDTIADIISNSQSSVMTPINNTSSLKRNMGFFLSCDVSIDSSIGVTPLLEHSDKSNDDPIDILTTQESLFESSKISESNQRLHAPRTTTKGVISPQLRAVARYLHELPHRQVRLIHRQHKYADIHLEPSSKT